VTLALAEVPAEIGCLRVTAAGVDRTAARDFAVTPGQPFTTVLTGVPLGTVAFSAGAYPGSCEEVTASTHPAWISEEEIVAVVLGRQASVSLTLHRNGRAKVTIDFADEPACTATGAACVSSSQCCSRSCSRGTCQDPDAGTEPTAPDASPPDTPES
jgi:hypothetical protein